MFTRLVLAIQGLTRLHIVTVPWDEVNFGRSTAFFSLVGLMIGTILWAVSEVAGKYYPAPVVAVLLLGAEMVITGGMHLDGFMDSMDGLFSGRPQERKLEIMRDSRVGANGVMAVVVLLLLKFTLLIDLPKPAWAVLPLMAALGRWANVYCLIAFPYARPEGLGKAYQKHTALPDVLFALLVAVVAAYLLLGVEGLVVAGVATLLVHLMGRQINSTLGGLTGDTYGAIIEITEVVTLLAVYILA